MSTTWILVASATHATIYTTHKAKLFSPNGHDERFLTLLQSIDNAAGRKKISDLVSDKSGRYQGGGAFHGAYEEESDPKTIETNRFARRIATILNKGRIEKAYDDLIIVAPAQFEGLLNKHLNIQLERLISKTIKKDYTHCINKDLVQHLQLFL